MKTISKFICMTTFLCATSAQADILERDVELERNDVPGYFSIDSISHAGSGCPAGTVAENVSPDRMAFTLLFDEFYAEVGPMISAREKRKNCSVNLSFDYPGGWQFALVNLHTRGYVSLDENIIGVQQTSFYFQGQSQTGRFVANYRGQIDQDYINVTTIPFSNTFWSPCGARRSLNINSEVRIDNSRSRRGQGLFTIDSIDGQVTHLYGVAWRRCQYFRFYKMSSSVGDCSLPSFKTFLMFT